MGEYREIITKAVVASGCKKTQSNYTVKPKNKPVKVLGCWVVNHQFDAKKIDKYVELNGSFDINIWYSYRDCGETKTDVMSEKVTYCDKIKLKNVDNECIDTKKVIARAVEQPNCLEATLCEKKGVIDVVVEKEMAVEVIGETKICVRVSPNQCGNIRENYTLEVNDDELASIDTSFLEQ